MKLDESEFTKDELCLLEILKAKSPLTTAEILEMSKQLGDLCAGCSSGAHVVNAGLGLREKGVVRRKWVKSEFSWELL